MAVETEVSWLDVNGVIAKNSYWTTDSANSLLALQLVRNLSNAQITGAFLRTPIDISGLTNAAATNANIETALAKMNILLNGPASGGAQPLDSVRLEIPAPKGTLINGLTGDPTLAAFTDLLAYILSSHGAAMTKVKSVKYARSR